MIGPRFPEIFIERPGGGLVYDDPRSLGRPTVYRAPKLPVTVSRGEFLEGDAPPNISDWFGPRGPYSPVSKSVGVSSFTPLVRPEVLSGGFDDLEDDAGVETLSPSDADGDDRGVLNSLNVPESESGEPAPRAVAAAPMICDGTGALCSAVKLFIGWKILTWLVG